jgi:hypothetical protein
VDEEALDLLVHDQISGNCWMKRTFNQQLPENWKRLRHSTAKLVFLLLPLEPVVELGDYKSIRMKYELPEITDKDNQRSDP